MTVGWSELTPQAKNLRLMHIAIGSIELASLGYLWLRVLTGRRDRFLTMACAALLLQGAAIVVGHGNCPLGPIQARLGDPVPFFELFLPKRVDKAAFPVLITMTLAGLAVIGVRYARSLDLLPPAA